MPFLDVFWSGSLISGERLMQAREQYSPTAADGAPLRSFGDWTQRLCVQDELTTAREMAGLSDAELTSMETEFLQSPMRPRSRATRATVPTGALGVALSGAGLLACALLGAAETRWLQGACAAGLLISLLVMCTGLLIAFGSVHLEICHGTAGLLFGRLNEQHPWLFKAMRLTQTPAAEQYRQRVLRERGCLRGVDCVLMREIVRVDEAMTHMRPARAVAEQIQRAGAPARSRRSGEQVRLVDVSVRRVAHSRPA